MRFLIDFKRGLFLTVPDKMWIIVKFCDESNKTYNTKNDVYKIIDQIDLIWLDLAMSIYIYKVPNLVLLGKGPFWSRSENAYAVRNLIMRFDPQSKNNMCTKKNLKNISHTHREILSSISVSFCFKLGAKM